MFISDAMLQKLKRDYPAGTRVKLMHMTLIQGSSLAMREVSLVLMTSEQFMLNGTVAAHLALFSARTGVKNWMKNRRKYGERKERKDSTRKTQILQRR